MTIWYRCRGMGGKWARARAYTVRPDLWPAGWVVGLVNGHGRARGPEGQMFADWTVVGRELYPPPGGGDPGVAEAAILAGVLRADNGSLVGWVPEH